MALDKEKIIAGALKYLQKGQIDKALKEYSRILEVEPGDVRVLLRVAELHARKGAAKEAVDSYMKVAEIYTTQGFFLKAVAVYKNILKIDEKNVTAYENLANLYTQLGLSNDARTQYSQLCGMLEESGKTLELLSALRKMVDLDPNDVLSRVKLGEMYFRDGHTEEAAGEFMTAAAALKSMGRLEEYLRVGERYFSIKQDDIAVGAELAEINLERHDPKRALQKLQACYKIDPHAPKILELLAQAFDQLGMKNNVASAYRELIRVYDERGLPLDAARARQRLGEIAPQEPAPAAQPVMPVPPPAPAAASAAPPAPQQPEQKPQEQQEPHAAAVEEAPELQIARLLAETDVYIKYGLRPKALVHLGQILKINPDNLDAHRKLRFVYDQAGDAERAISELMAIGRIELKSGDPDSARTTLLEVLSRRPEDGEARRLMSMISSGGTLPQDFLEGEKIEVAPDESSFHRKMVEQTAVTNTAEPDFEIDITPEKDAVSTSVSLDMESVLLPDILPDEMPDLEQMEVVPDDVVETIGSSPAEIESVNEVKTTPEIETDLEEAIFLFEQGLNDEAGEICARLIVTAPDDSRVAELARRIQAKASGTSGGVEPESIEELSDVIEELSPGPSGGHSPRLDLQEILAEFKKGISREVSPSDARTHFDLGCAYRDMGLYDDSISEFKLAMTSQDLELRALQMIALCYVGKGDFSKGVSTLKHALYYDNITPAQTMDFLYEIGLAYETMGDPEEAMYYLRKVQKRDPTYRNLDDHLTKLGEQSKSSR